MFGFYPPSAAPLSALLGRRVDVALAIGETIADTVAVKRTRANQFSIVETQVHGANLGRGRTVVPTIAETEVQAGAFVRERTVVFPIAETEIHSANVARTTRLIAPSIAETEIIANNIARSRKIQAAITESEAVTSALKRARSGSFSVSESEVLTNALNRTRTKALSIVETEVLTNALKRIRAESFSIAEIDEVSTLVNMLKYSEELNQTAWVKQVGDTVTPNTHIAPDGTLTADTLTRTNAAEDYQNFSCIQGVRYAFSAWFRADATMSGQIKLGRSSSNPQVTTTTALTTSWQLLSVTWVADITTTGFANFGSTTSGSMQIWGAQLNLGSTRTTYLRTGATATARVPVLRTRKVVPTIAEVETLSATIKRAAGLALSLSEVEVLSAEVKRGRTLQATMPETVTDIAAIKRARAVVLPIAETQSISVSLTRLKQLALALAETYSYTFTASKAKMLSATIAELETHSFGGIRRTRKVTDAIAEVVAYAGALRRARTVTAAVAEQEVLAATLKRVRALQSTLSEVEAITPSLARRRNVASAIAELEIVGAALARLKLMAFVDAQTQGNAFWLSRVRKVVATIAEVEAFTAVFGRARAFVIPIAETEFFAFDFGRLRTQLLTISETQGYEAALARVRLIAEDIAQVTGYTFTLDVVREPNIVTVTITWQEWETVGSAQQLSNKTEVIELAARAAATVVVETSAGATVIVPPAEGDTFIVPTGDSFTSVIPASMIGRLVNLEFTVNESETINVDVKRARTVASTIIETEVIAPTLTEYITSGLVMMLDAADPLSYAGTGAIWADIIGARQANLFNGPTYTVDAGVSSFVFDGLNDMGSIPNTTALSWTPDGTVGLQTISVELWVKSSDVTGYLYTKPWNGSGQYNIMVTSSGLNLTAGSSGTITNSIAFARPVCNGTWTNVVCWANGTQMGYYINGTAYSGSKNHLLTGNIPTAGNVNVPIALMTLYPYGAGWTPGLTDFSIAGNMAVCKIYNRVLSPTEVTKNFNAFRGRYGL